MGDETFTFKYSRFMTFPYPASLADLVQSPDVFDFLCLNARYTQDSTTSTIYTYHFRDKEYIAKVINPAGWKYKIHSGNNPLAKAQDMNHLYGIYAKYLGERIAPTAYVVVKNSTDQELVVAIQPKIEGEKYDDQRGMNDPRFKELADTFENIRSTEAFQALPKEIQDSSYDWSFGVDGSIIETPEGKLVLIDW